MDHINSSDFDGEQDAMGGDIFWEDDESHHWTSDMGSKSTHSFSLFEMPDAEDLNGPESSFSVPQQYNASSAKQPLAAASNMGGYTRAMEDPNYGCDAMEPIPFPSQKPPEYSQPMALVNQLQMNQGNPMEQYPNQASSSAAAANLNPVLEFLRLQQEIAKNDQLLRAGYGNINPAPPTQYATLTTSQHMTVQVPCNATNYASMPTMIQGPWYAKFNQVLTTPIPNWEAMQAQGLAHPGNAPTSMNHAFPGAGPSPELFMAMDQEHLKMESSFPLSPSVLAQESSGMNIAAAGARPTSPPSHADFLEGSEKDSQESDKKPAAKVKSMPVVRPKPKDICFALINHPGTRAWREKVDNLAMHIDLEWSDRVHQAVKSQLEAEGRRFLVCVKAIEGQSKGVKNKEWRTATDDEIMLKTKQRFRDRRKPQRTEVKRPRGRPSNKAKLSPDAHTTALARRPLAVDLRVAFIEAIEQCRRTLEQTSLSQDASGAEKFAQARQKLELLLPMNQLRWSHVLESELLQQQVTGSNMLMLLDLESDVARKYDGINKLKKAEIQIVNFIRCLMENGSNELNAALDSVRGNSDDSYNGPGDGGDDVDDEDDDEEDEDGSGHDHMNSRVLQESLFDESQPRKRGRGAGAAEAQDPDFYQYDLLTVFQATPLAFTLKSGQARPLPPLDIDFEKKALADALRDARNVGARVDIEFEVATTDRLGAFLAKGECHVMHLSCHGHPDYLAIDNGWGGMQIIRVHELERFIRFGAGNLELVFLSSCCSRPAGEAFVAAGVPHVICCHHDQKPRDKVAIEFARNFYRALACGKTLKTAFNLAKQSIHVSSQGSPSEAGKFILLPEKPEDDDYHDVQIFKERNRRLRGLTIPNTTAIRPFPCLPGNVKMNSLDVYHVLELLSRVDVVKITGSTGGRRLAAAAASYIRSRPHTMSVDDIFWFPPVVESDDASKLFRRVCDILEGGSHLSRDELMGEGSKYISHFNEAMSYFVGKRCLFVINAKRFKSDVQCSRLERFLCDVLDDLQVKIILVCGDGPEDRYNRLPKHREQIGTYTPLRCDPETLYDDARASRSRPYYSDAGVAGDDESLSDLSEASLPFEIHVGTEKSRSELAQLTLSTHLEHGEARATVPLALKKAGVRSDSRDEELGSRQLGPLLENVTLINKASEKGKKRKSEKRRVARGLRVTHDDDSCTSASSGSSSSQAHASRRVRTLDSFDAKSSSQMASPSLAQISSEGRSKIGAKDVYSDVTPFLKKNLTQGFRLDATGKARLYGRDSEIALLRDAYNRISLSGAPSEIICVHGPSGTGKSTLVKHMEEIAAIDRSGIFASGKFDQINAAARPYSAIVDAISRLCRRISESSGVDNVKQNIKQALGADVKVISELAPAIAQLIEQPASGDDFDVGSATEHAFTRFKDIFRSFVRTLSSPNHPIILFLDDLQWADDASRELIESVAVDPESKNIIFIWAYRDNEIGSGLQSLVSNLTKSPSIRFSDVPLGAIDSQSLKEMISDLVQLSQEEVKPLSDLLCRRTGGNIHFVIQFLHMLQQECLLVYSDELQKWDWDIELIETQTVVTENVADLLTAKIARLPGDVQSVLQLACCLGFFFDIQLLESVASSEGLLSESRPPAAPLLFADPEEIEPGEMFFSSDHGHKKFLRLLQIARKENLVIQTQDPYKLKFAHDRVRQCVYEMIRNPEKREELHLRIGMLIWKQNKSKTMDEMTHFIAIDQLNRGSRHIKDDDTRSRLAQLNLESAGKAVHKSAYTLAADFLDKGIALLNPRTMWQKQTYGLCLELHSKSAEMESTLGKFDTSDRRVSTVLHQARTLDDKLRAYYVKLDSLGVRRRMEEAISLGLEILRQIGESISQHPSTFSTIVELAKTKRVLKGRKGHELLTLHEMTDDRKVVAMRLLNSIAFFAWHSDRNDVLTFTFLRMTKITLTFGLCKFSPFAFAAFGMLLGVLGDIQQAYDFGTLALQLLEKARTRECNSSTQLIVFGFLEHLKKPLSLIAHNFKESYRVGMECGQVQYACQCLSALGGLHVVMGKPLRFMLVDTQRMRRIFHEYNQQFADVLTAPWHQFALNMTGQAENVKVLTGDAMDEAVFLNEAVVTMAKVNVHFIRMVMLYILGDFEAASAELDVLERRSGDTEGTHYMSYFKILFSGLVCLAMAQKTRRRKYFAGSRRYINQISKFAKGGGLNCSPMLMLMQAVQKTTERGRNMADVKLAFDNTIVACARSGFTYMEAIANERAGEYALSWGSDYEAQTHLNRAWQLFSEWDAEVKVGLLEKKYLMLRSAKETLSLSLLSQSVEVEDH
jgi:predicted ATPase